MSKLANLIRYFPTVLNARVLDYLTQKKTFSVSGMSNHTSKVFTVVDAMRENNGLKGAVWIVNSAADIDLVGKDVKMWSEYETRFQIPKINKDCLRNYIFGNSRLISTVFYSITIENAYKLSAKHIPESILKNLINLRRVRQLNDELIDIYEDISEGLVTYPLLIALANKKYTLEIKKYLRLIWASNNKSKYLDELVDLLIKIGSIKKSALHSYKLLITFLNSIMEHFHPKNAFDITLILNQRIALLTRLEQNGWKQVDVKKLYFPTI